MTSRRAMIWLTLALLAWGSFLAVGSLLGGANLQNSFRRGLVVIGCMAVFLALWWMLLLTQRRRPPEPDPDNENSESTKKPT